eukprot:TRINITY_DN8554_c0_g1_i1.p1 TRINITY_DN8554_c0_g1~~TRINITY_DN8554_c0_g1_i1.p1  ORF type:complete len:395 (+),score=70.15 TRINITY_DN8554_c0_g1_i1:28-1185(+)
MSKTYKTAMIVQPPPELTNQIQSLRANYDKAYVRWMPHINLMFPFVEASLFMHYRDRLEDTLKEFDVFTVTLRKFKYFQHRSSATVFLEPEVDDPQIFEKIVKKLLSVVPFCDDQLKKSASGFTPHLTVGQKTGKLGVTRAIKNWQSDFNPITFTVDKLFLIARDDTTPFEVVETIYLGGATRPFVEETVTTTGFFGNQDYIVKTRDRFNQLPDGELGNCIVRIEKWLKRQCELNTLPKSRNKLENATKNLRKYRKVSADADQIKELLIQEELIKIVDGKVQYLQKDSEDSIPTTGYMDYGYNSYSQQNDEEYVTDLCRDWVKKVGNIPNTEKKLVNCLKQLVVIKTEASFDDILNYLSEEGAVSSESYSGEVIYNHEVIMQNVN